jgi:hypothetical protein
LRNGNAGRRIVATMTTKRMGNESAKAYEAFKTYAEMGATRSHAAVGRTLGKSKKFIERWSSQYDWKERAAQWDNEHAAREEKADEIAKLAFALEREKLRLRIQKKAVEWYDKLFAKAEQIHRWPLDRQTTTQTDAQGNAVAVTIEPIHCRLSDLPRIIECADALGRIAAGLPSKVTSITDPEGKPFTIPQAPAGPVQFVLNVKRTDETERIAADVISKRPAKV